MAMLNTVTGVPAPQSPEELELLVSLGHNIPYFPRMSKSEQDELLRQLEAYECLAQVVKLLEWRIQHGRAGDSQLFADYLWLMRVAYFGLENFDRFCDIAAECASVLRLPFSMMRLHVAEEILGNENFHAHAKLYARIIGSVPERSQQILLLERLALIYEKKLFLEADVESAYRRLLELDPTNIKALRFYKFLHIQSGQWKEATIPLERLINAATNPYEKQRAAHELAQIYLYNLNQPQQAKDLIMEYCSNSQLDTRQTLIEALERLEAFDELLSVLQQVEQVSKDPIEKANARLKISLVNIKAGKMDAALAAARDSIALSPHNLLAHEALISAIVETGDLEALARALGDLAQNVSMDSSKKALAALQKRANALHGKKHGITC